jgi:hypothetical protein
MEKHMTYITNVGLNVGDIVDAVTPEAAVAVFRELGLNPELLGVRRSRTENTAIIKVEGGNIRASIYRAAEYLWQDAIAVYDPRTREGWLIGPNAASWGEFDLNEFKLPEGVA